MFPIEKADEKNGGWSGIDSLGRKGSKRDENERRIESTAFTTLWRVSRKLKGDDQCKPVRNSLSNASRVCSTDTSPSMRVLSFFFISPLFPPVVYFTRGAFFLSVAFDPASDHSFIVIANSFIARNSPWKTANAWCREEERERERARIDSFVCLHRQNSIMIELWYI